MYMMVPCAPPGEDEASEEIAMDLLHNWGVAVSPGIGFGAGGGNFLRLSFACAEGDVAAGTRLLGQYLVDRGAREWWLPAMGLV
mmetsp:Transcript_12465/g.31080  ORF Transcript_12465/g.31080 Transcript_12465/m.31080 type:complete len:84 (+) Transcript_12465:1-252(+)